VSTVAHNAAFAERVDSHKFFKIQFDTHFASSGRIGRRIKAHYDAWWFTIESKLAKKGL
jgi:hypothetical protein